MSSNDNHETSTSSTSKKHHWTKTNTVAVILFVATMLTTAGYVFNKPSLDAWLSWGDSDPTSAAPEDTPDESSASSYSSKSDTETSDEPTPSKSERDDAESAEPPNTQYLSDMDHLGGGHIGSDSVDINGEIYPRSIYHRVGGCDDDLTFEYDLGRDWTTFTATAGLTANTESGTIEQFQVFVDGEPVTPEYRLTMTEDQKIKVSVKGALRLKLSMIMIEGDEGLCSDAGDAAWGDAKLSRLGVLTFGYGDYFTVLVPVDLAFVRLAQPVAVARFLRRP